ncbi:type IV conjugative transfer system coupling protein TraD [Nitrogeniibacter aestuarii]|uniref:type IV conjugative transfer system coupling protein TraD n=1 Tax=Nitrogeniibacter aestuarii TaxID=2815343 RepID=UPI001E4A6EB0|nr:type IV conjugative transfer system coupling protein TraD [Nitrogeniibacter aestuarii]
MKASGELEALLRPPVEIYSAFTAFVAAAISAYAPWVFMMPVELGYLTAGFLIAFGLVRARAAYAVMRYQLGLYRYKITATAPHQLPRIAGKIFLGFGFSWSQEHTQRLHDARRPEASQFVRAPGLVRRLQGFLIALKKTPAAFLVAWTLSARYWWNPLGIQPDLGGSPSLHGVEPNETNVGWNQADRNGHLLVLGTTRVGKTRLLELLVSQDIRDGHVTIVIDPKGDADLMMRVYAEAARAGRLDQLYLFHLGYPEISARYNAIGSFGRITEVANKATNSLPSGGNSAAFKEFAWRFTNISAQAQVRLGETPTYESLKRSITDIEPLFIRYTEFLLSELKESGAHEDWEADVERVEALIEQKKFPVDRALQTRRPRMIALVDYIKNNPIEDGILLGLSTAVRYERSFFEKIVASLGPFLEKLTTGAVAHLISPNYFDNADDRPIFDWTQVIRQGGIVYVGLDALSDSVVAGAVGNAMLADLVSVGGKLYKYGLDPHDPEGNVTLPRIACHFDEVNEIAGPEFVPMVNKLGGAGFMIHAYTQTIPDIEAKTGSAPAARQILGNFNHLVMLRVKDDGTASFLADQLPEVDVTLMTSISGVTDTDGSTGVDFVSQNQDRRSTQRVPMVAASDIMALPKGQAYALIEGNRLYKLRFPMPSTEGDSFVPPSLKAVAVDMRQKYRTSEHWVDETDWFSGHSLGLQGVAA